MTDTGPIVLSIIGTGVGIGGLTAVLAGLLWRSISRQFDAVGRQLHTVNGRLERLESRIDDTNKRIDAIGRDIAELRDRTGTLEGTLSTFMNAGRSPNAA